MNPTAFENLQKCYERHVVPAGYAAAGEAVVLGIGAAGGGCRDVFNGEQFRLRAAGLAEGDGVDIVLDDFYRVPLADESVDIVVAVQVLHRCGFFWRAFDEMARVMQPDGFIFLVEPSAGPSETAPGDCYRFCPDAYAALAEHAGCHLQAVWRDERGPWHDLVGVFRKRPVPSLPSTTAAPGVAEGASSAPPSYDSRPEEEIVGGTVDYIEVLKQAHEAIRPASYLEIGVRHGRSLALAGCPALGIDPAPEIGAPLPAATRVVEMTSDRFFDEQACELVTEAPDLAFIDGMHLFEYALRDFMNVERLASPTTLVVVDDIYPNHPRQAARDRATRVWTGDVWRLHRCLAEMRPDLFLLPLDTRPTGLLLVAGLDSGNRVLWDGYNAAVEKYRDQDSGVPPESVIERQGSLDPQDPLVGAVFRVLGGLRAQGQGPSQVKAALEDLRSRFA